jgi:hypothetical protein
MILLSDTSFDNKAMYLFAIFQDTKAGASTENNGHCNLVCLDICQLHLPNNVKASSPCPLWTWPAMMVFHDITLCSDISSNSFRASSIRPHWAQELTTVANVIWSGFTPLPRISYNVFRACPPSPIWPYPAFLEFVSNS